MPVDYTKMKVAELKDALKAKDLPTSGSKADLIQRLQTSEEGEDDLLDQDDSMTEEAIKQAEQELTEATKTTPEKLKRVPISSPTKPEDTQGDPLTPKGKENEPAKVVKITPEPEKSKSITDDDDQAKIKSRAERFGGFQSEEARKAARLAKYGEMLSKGPTPVVAAGGNVVASSPEELERLKKRAGRFGTSTSTVLKTAEVSEAIKRRQERFGIVSPDEPKPKKITLNSGVNSVVMDEKMKARIERFKMEVK